MRRSVKTVFCIAFFSLAATALADEAAPPANPPASPPATDTPAPPPANPPATETPAAPPVAPEEAGSPPRPSVLERTPQSGTLVRHYLPEPKIVLRINPELLLGGMLSNYRDLGYFMHVSFGGGVGFTYLEDWHFRLNLWALTEEHKYKGTNSGRTTKHRLWFVQPAAYAMYRAAHFPKYHYFVPMDLFLGVKVGMNAFVTDSPFGKRDNEMAFLYGIAVMPRFHVWDGFGIGPTLEVSTLDYLANFFFHYGLSFYWDFEVMGKGNGSQTPASSP